MTSPLPSDHYPFTSVNISPSNPPALKRVSWKSPSNIALVKYWGKKPVQIPTNASISFTLDHAHTITSVQPTIRKGGAPFITFSFEGSKAPAFAHRIERFFTSLFPIMPWIENYNWEIESENSFPHSSGIASSASSMSALALCLCDLESQFADRKLTHEDFYKKASYVARLGSGSAARSVFPKLASWGSHKQIVDSTNLYATPHMGVAKVFSTFHDDIIIVSKEKKSVSSSAGHRLMETNPFASTRYQQANEHLSSLLLCMKEGDLSSFGKIVEDEALTLHALMMCSNPSYILLEPNTLEIIKRIRLFREKTGLHVYFTLDAGPNVHILYPDYQKEEISAFIQEDLLSFAEDGLIIKDQIGAGPQKLL